MNNDMNLNTDIIKAERERRAWSQSHLADAAGVSLRTMQRVEATGTASKETTLAIASALSTSVEHLVVVKQQVPDPRGVARFTWPAAMAVGLAIGSVFIAQQAFARQLMLDIKLGIDGQQPQSSRMIIDAGKPAEMRVDGKIKVVITPTLKDNGEIVLATKIYTFNDGNFALMAEPTLIINDNAEASVTSDSEKTGNYSLSITPHVINKP
jgi:transcriptional regulator with XRE-family HTH domain